MGRESDRKIQDSLFDIIFFLVTNLCILILLLLLQRINQKKRKKDRAATKEKVRQEKKKKKPTPTVFCVQSLYPLLPVSSSFTFNLIIIRVDERDFKPQDFANINFFETPGVSFSSLLFFRTLLSPSFYPHSLQIFHYFPLSFSLSRWEVYNYCNRDVDHCLVSNNLKRTEFQKRKPWQWKKKERKDSMVCIMSSFPWPDSLGRKVDDKVQSLFRLLELQQDSKMKSISCFCWSFFGQFPWRKWSEITCINTRSMDHEIELSKSCGRRFRPSVYNILSYHLLLFRFLRKSSFPAKQERLISYLILVVDVLHFLLRCSLHSAVSG